MQKSFELVTSLESGGNQVPHLSLIVVLQEVVF